MAEPLQVGVMFWTGGVLGFDAPADEIARSVRELGVTCGQLGAHDTVDLGPESAATWKKALADNGLEITAVFMQFEGESYASIPACAATVGFVPAATRAERERRAVAVSDFAAALGVDEIAVHVGCLPHDRAHADYVGVVELTQRLCDHAAGHGQTLGLETGQEPVALLKEFIGDVGRENLKVNFDPANLILYGWGEPLKALDEVADFLISVHCKDADPPKKEGEWGSETPLGEGSVGMDRFVAKLKKLGYTGPLTIEREIVGEAQREDIKRAIALLERLRAA